MLITRGLPRCLTCYYQRGVQITKFQIRNNEIHCPSRKGIHVLSGRKLRPCQNIHSILVAGHCSITDERATLGIPCLCQPLHTRPSKTREPFGCMDLVANTKDCRRFASARASARDSSIIAVDVLYWWNLVTGGGCRDSKILETVFRIELDHMRATVRVINARWFRNGKGKVGGAVCAAACIIRFHAQSDVLEIYTNVLVSWSYAKRQSVSLSSNVPGINESGLLYLDGSHSCWACAASV